MDASPDDTPAEVEFLVSSAPDTEEVIGKHLDRTQVLAHNPDWTETDREKIARYLDMYAVSNFHQPPKSAYIKCSRKGEVRPVMWIQAGFISWEKDDAPPEASERNEGQWAVLLSRSTNTGARMTSKERDYGTCPECSMALTPTGECSGGWH